MPTFEQGQIVRVPCPYIDRIRLQHRPALVISNGPLGEENRLLWVAMITSAENRPWPGDCPIPDHAAAHLPIPSVIRTAKLATIEVRDAQVVGSIPKATLDRVLAMVLGNLGQ